MFSRIAEFLRPPSLQKEPNPSQGVARTGREQGRGGQQKRDGREAAEEVVAEDDVTLISTEAIRRLLQEAADKQGLDRKIALLLRLEQHGIMSIPVRQGQSVWSALDEAERFI